MTAEVDAAVSELRSVFPKTEAEGDAEGGAYVLIDDVATGSLYVQDLTWVGFRITFQYPFADVYPHFVRPDLTRTDGRALGDGLSGGHTFLGRPAIQVSRRSSRLNPTADTALLKLLKVMDWLRTHP